ncbi:MAG: hypothetical protein GY852_02605 [bacterium]|nr:hypothetical protein [bacterium]
MIEPTLKNIRKRLWTKKFGEREIVRRMIEVRKRCGKEIFNHIFGNRVPNTIKEVLTKIWSGCISDEKWSQIWCLESPGCCRWCGSAEREDLTIQHIIGCPGSGMQRDKWRKNTETLLKSIGVVSEEEREKGVTPFWKHARDLEHHGERIFNEIRQQGVFAWRTATTSQDEQRERETALGLWDKKTLAGWKTKCKYLVRIRHKKEKELRAKGHLRNKNISKKGQSMRRVEEVWRQIMLHRRQTTLDIWHEYQLTRAEQRTADNWMGKAGGTLSPPNEGKFKTENRWEQWANEVKWFDESQKERIERWKSQPRKMHVKKGEMERFLAKEHQLRKERYEEINEKREMLKTIEEVRQQVPAIFDQYRTWLGTETCGREYEIAGLALETGDVEILFKGLGQKKWLNIIKRKVIQEFWKSGGAKQGPQLPDDHWKRWRNIFNTLQEWIEYLHSEYEEEVAPRTETTQEDIEIDREGSISEPEEDEGMGQSRDPGWTLCKGNPQREWDAEEEVGRNEILQEWNNLLPVESHREISRGALYWWPRKEKWVRASGITYTEGWKVRSTQDNITWIEIPIEEIRTSEEVREHGIDEATRNDEWQDAEREVVRKRKKKTGDYVQISEIQEEIAKRKGKKRKIQRERKRKASRMSTEVEMWESVPQCACSQTHKFRRVRNCATCGKKLCSRCMNYKQQQKGDDTWYQCKTCAQGIMRILLEEPEEIPEHTIGCKCECPNGPEGTITCEICEEKLCKKCNSFMMSPLQKKTTSKYCVCTKTTCMERHYEESMARMPSIPSESGGAEDENANEEFE